MLTDLLMVVSLTMVYDGSWGLVVVMVNEG